MTKEQAKELGLMIKIGRVKKDLTIAELSKQTGVAISVISSLEGGDVDSKYYHKPTLSTLFDLNKVLELDENKLIELIN